MSSLFYTDALFFHDRRARRKGNFFKSFFPTFYSSTKQRGALGFVFRIPLVEIERRMSHAQSEFDTFIFEAEN